MNHRIGRGLWVAAALVASAIVAADVKADVIGSWKLAVQLDDATALSAMVDLMKTDDGYGGTFNLENGLAEAELQDVSVDGNKVSFKVEADMQGQALVADFSGTVEGEKFTGSVDYDLGGAPGTLEVNGELVAVKAAGAWNFELTTPDGVTLKPTLVISVDGDSVSGQFLDEEGNGGAPDSIALEGAVVTFQTTTDYGGATVVSNWTGTVKGDELNGTLVFELDGQTGEIDFTGARAPAVAEGIWNLSLDTPDGAQLNPVLVIEKDGDDLSGTFTDDSGSSTEATELSFEDGALAWHIEADFGGQTLVADWSGNVAGDSLSGSVTYDLAGQAGELEFNGSRAKVEKVATWDLLVTTEDGQALESKLTIVKVGDKLDGTYIGVTGEEVELKNLTQDGDNLKFEFSADFGGDTLSGTFDGTVDGDSYTGTVSYELAGTPGELPFEGKKADE